MSAAYKFFKNLPALSSLMHKLNKYEIKMVLERIKVIIQEQGETLFHQGDPSKHAYVVLMGTIQLYDEKILIEHNPYSDIDDEEADRGVSKSQIFITSHSQRASQEHKPRTNTSDHSARARSHAEQRGPPDAPTKDEAEVASLNSDDIADTELNTIAKQIRKRFEQRVQTC